jgi:hypothetical protein
MNNEHQSTTSIPMQSRNNSRRGWHRHGHGPTLFQLFVVIVGLVLTSSAAAAAVVGVDPYPNNSEHHRRRHHHDRRLQFTSSTPDLSSLFTNGTAECPVDCPLCECALPTTTISTNSSSTTTTATASDGDLETCIYSKSIEACASGSLPKCYASLLPFDFDLEGLCSVQCDAAKSPSSSTTSTSQQSATICRICDIFACCTNCPAEDVDQCFPPISSSGYTPVGWEPLVCDDVGGGGGSTTGGTSKGCFGTSSDGRNVVIWIVLVVVTQLAWQV